jgi:hypothetical protein
MLFIPGFIAGLILAALTLRDVFDTIVVPGGSKASLRVTRRIVFAILPVYRWLVRRPLGVGFAPFVLLITFIIWVSLLTLAFAAMIYSAKDFFLPKPEDFSQALYLAGSAVATIGFGRPEVLGIARAIVVAAGFSGLAVMTVGVTYLLEVQRAIAARDAGILKVTTTSGQPPSGTGLLQQYAELGCREELRHILRGGRDWIATVLQSHASHPSLIYFRSPETEAGWPAILGTFMDMALMFDMLIDDDKAKAPAALLLREGTRMAESLMRLINLERAPDRVPAEDFEKLSALLHKAGYRLREDVDKAAFMERRRQYSGCIAALASHLGTPPAPLLPAGQ